MFLEKKTLTCCLSQWKRSLQVIKAFQIVCVCVCGRYFNRGNEVRFMCTRHKTHFFINKVVFPAILHLTSPHMSPSPCPALHMHWNTESSESPSDGRRVSTLRKGASGRKKSEYRNLSSSGQWLAHLAVNPEAGGFESTQGRRFVFRFPIEIKKDNEHSTCFL